MIDLTPLDVRNKRGDFKKMLRGYDPQEVDVFLELCAERMEVLVREVLRLRERTEALQEQVSSQSGREKAVQEALVTAQELRKDIHSQAEREADLVLQEVQVEARRQRAEAEAEVRGLLRDAERKLQQSQDSLDEMEHRRLRFLKAFRQLLERELDVVEVEEGRTPLEDRTIDLDLGSGRRATRAEEASGAVVPTDTGVGAETGVTGEAEEPSPPLDAPVDELAALYEGLQGPLDELATRYDAMRGAGSAEKEVAPGEATPETEEPSSPAEDVKGDDMAERRFFPPPPPIDRDDDPRWG